MEHSQIELENLDDMDQEHHGSTLSLNSEIVEASIESRNSSVLSLKTIDSASTYKTFSETNSVDENVEKSDNQQEDNGVIEVITTTKVTKRFKVEVGMFTFLFLLCASCVFIGYHVNQSNTKLWPWEQEKQTGFMPDQCNYTELLGDKKCDDLANSEACQYDLGDCCSLDHDRNTCQSCFCHLDSNETFIKCDLDNFVPWTQEKERIFPLLGNGICDLDYNNVKYDFDLGDCCIENVQCVKRNETQYFGKREIACPEKVCIQSNVFCIQSEIGDGICQDYNNVELCDLDGGDCCLPDKGPDCCYCSCQAFYDNLHLVYPFPIHIQYPF